MGTRSLTRVETSDGKQIINLYRQFDGYPSGHGLDLFKFLDGKRIINGIQTETAKEAANGAGCLAAQLVENLKTGIGEFYLLSIDKSDCWQDYDYIITVTEAASDFRSKSNGEVKISCASHGKQLFNGSVADFGVFCNKVEEEDEE
jgi:hypothetical protein